MFWRKIRDIEKITGMEMNSSKSEAILRIACINKHVQSKSIDPRSKLEKFLFFILSSEEFSKFFY